MAETISVPLDETTKQRLETLAAQSQRSPSSLAAEAIEAYIDSYVELEDWQVEEIQAGIAELDSGRGIPHEKVMEWVKSWGTDNQLPRPK